MKAETRVLIGHVPPGGTWRDIPPHLLPNRYRGMRRTDSTNLFGRLDASLPAYTITTQFDNVTTGCFTHPVEDRPLSAREGARLQTFPDTYRFVGSLTSRCRQIGNAVPPLLAHTLAHSIANHIGGEAAAVAHPAPIRPVRGRWPNHPSTDDEVAQARRRRDARQDTIGVRLVQAELARQSIAFTESLAASAPLRVGDILLEEHRIAVMVNSCFWNGCDEHASKTKSSTKWWASKIAENRERDDATVKSLTGAGWDVSIFWEHEKPEDVVRHIKELIDAKERALADAPEARAPRLA